LFYTFTKIKKMKIILLPFLLIFSLNLLAQAPFEGKVTHKLTTETTTKSGMVEIYYGKKMIKGIIRQNDEKDLGKDDLLLDFNKGLVIHLNSIDKTYRMDSMKGKSPGMMSALDPMKDQNRVILGYHTSAYIPKDTAGMNLFGNMSLVFWYADSLLFPIDEQFIGSDDIALFTNGKTIGMGLNMNLEIGESKKTFELDPLLIEPGNLPDSIFDIPGDFVMESIVADSIAMVDTTYTTPAPAEKKIIKKKTPAKPARSKQPVKSKTALRKE